MSDEALIAELERQRESAKRCFASYDALWKEQGVASDGPRPDVSGVIDPIIAVLRTHPVFDPGRNIFFAGKQLYFDPFHVSHALLLVMLKHDAASAVAWLHRVFKVECAHLRMVAEVQGLEVQYQVDLYNGVRLLPFTAGPDSPLFRVFAAACQSSPSMELPAIAVFDMGVVAGSTDIEVSQEVLDSPYRTILDAVRAFTLNNSGAPVVGTTWVDFADPDLALAESPSYPLIIGRFEGSPSEAYPLKVDDEALAWAERYLRMDRQLRCSVAVALDRLNLARRRRSPGDQAIDSGICLEALLGDGSTQELTYKLQLRAALLIGTTLEQRREIRQAVNDLYKLRSKMVHGQIPKPKDRLYDLQIASRGLEICTQAVRAVVQLNAPPDFATWELTGRPRDNDGV